MAGVKRCYIIVLACAGALFLSTCRNALLDTVKAITDETTAPLAVSFSPDPGVYTLPQSVTLTANKDGTTIRYTTDGTDPTAQTGVEYSGPIAVSASTSIKARAFKDLYSDSAVAAGDFTIPYGKQVKKFAITPQTDAQFGWAVAVEGDYAIVGAPYETGPLSNQGAAYIFHRTGTDTWDDVVRIVATNPTAEHDFGYSVDIDGDYAIVGNGYWAGTGSAYIFHRTGPGNVWDTGCKIDPPAPVSNGYFGDAVSISGDYAVVGAFGEPGGISGSAILAGAVYIFHRTNTNAWADRTRYIDSGNGMANDNFGWAVAVSGDYMIVGSPYYDAVGGGSPPQNIGDAYIYHRTGTTTWAGPTRIMASVLQANANFGWSVDISGDYAIIGTPNETEGTTVFAGTAYVYHRLNLTDWELSVRLTATDPQTQDYFGDRVAISGDYAIGCAKMEDEVADRAGAIYSFHRTATNTWTLGPSAKHVATDGGSLQFFGNSVGMDGEYAIVGAYGWPGTGPTANSGTAYILH